MPRTARSITAGVHSFLAVFHQTDTSSVLSRVYPKRGTFRSSEAFQGLLLKPGSGVAKGTLTYGHERTVSSKFCTKDTSMSKDSFCTAARFLAWAHKSCAVFLRLHRAVASRTFCGFLILYRDTAALALAPPSASRPFCAAARTRSRSFSMFFACQRFHRTRCCAFFNSGLIRFVGMG